MDNEVRNWALRATKGRISANEALRELKAVDAGIRRQDFLALVREFRDDLSLNLKGIDRPGSRRPYTREMTFVTSSVATGYTQMVDIWVKDVETGEIYSRPYGIRTDDLMTHDDAIETALDRYQQHADFYGQSILAATYAGTLRWTPAQP